MFHTTSWKLFFFVKALRVKIVYKTTLVLFWFALKEKIKERERRKYFLTNYILMKFHFEFFFCVGCVCHNLYNALRKVDKQRKSK